MITKDKYLRLLAKEYPTAAKTVTEIINLEAIMNLPKATEHFISDLHGEYDAVQHVLRNGSGNVKEKIREIFQGRLSTREMNQLATIVYYPEDKIDMIVDSLESEEEINEFYSLTLLRITELCAFTVSKYTRSKVRKAIPADYAYIIEELLFKDTIMTNKEDYYEKIIKTVISLDRAPELIAAISHVIQRLVVDHLHVVGDIYDRGPFPDKIIDTFMDGHELDIQWGNHDVLWMGAASGSAACMANVIRICARYNNLEIIEDAYGISLRPLITFAEMVYKEDRYEPFMPKINTEDESKIFPEELRQIAKMNQAISIIQFKLEGEIIKRHPEFDMADRMVLDFINYETGTVKLDGKEYPMLCDYFPTVDPADPYRLTEEERLVVERLMTGFLNSERLQKHVQFLFSKGSMYLSYNDNLLFHGCVPLNPDGSFMELPIANVKYSGKALLDKYEEVLRKGYLNREGKKHNVRILDLIWYLWEGKASSLFGKDKMTTFERLYVAEKETHIEKKNLYYEQRDNVELSHKILKEFGLDPNKGHIINGHTPVKEKIGENPLKADGKLIVIDGGFSKAYQNTTGLAGYTLLYNSFGMQLVSHQPFTSRQDAIENEKDIVSTRRIVDKELERKTVRQTDVGKKLTQQVTDLHQLLRAYKSGEIVEDLLSDK
ncbi:MAG: fructose-1,6-bisphosphatase [Trichococcus flocculiformis]|mgnify:FL=1|jgi:fructose-1,6-bisphosphatase-3|uniref:Fructose-1,6-bisphosphatase class 3 n=1 Tax=Trichococcus flocculiformis TaxID=82803 RepID=A0A847D532_9LACT|nr:fructose-1,6-bisphosphatase [Trichococcus flocculiformis]MBP7129207.1 fructose-1,6-bisphosphatase [Trichococcus sp.]NCB65346.1 fructose-1,6-bisphosphatase [Bacilli bacterium]NLD31758.1 fructose-1,6-bisphosphatase [Trichococcus flocculiformis]